MVYTEVQIKNGRKYYYRTLTARKDGKFKKLRSYLGVNLSRYKIRQKEKEADLILHSQFGKTRKLGKKQALERIFRTRWLVYHNRASMIPILTGASLFDVFSTGFTKLFGYSYNQCLMVYKDNVTYAILPKHGLERLYQHAFQRLMKEPDALKKFIEIFRKKSGIFIKELREMDKKLNDNITNKDVVRYYNKYYKDYEEVCLYGEPFPFALQFGLPKYLETILKIKDDKKKLEIFTLLVNPSIPSFVNREEEELTDLAKKIKANDKWNDLFQSNVYTIINELKNFGELLSMIKLHTKKYFWITYDYIGKVRDEQYFIKRIKEIFSSRKLLQRDFKKGYRELIKKQEVEFRRLIHKGILDEYGKKLFLATQDATFLIDLKKEKLSQAHYYINRLLAIAAKRINIDLETLVFANKDELSKLLNTKMNVRLLKKRKIKSAFYFSERGNATFTNKDVDGILKYAEGKTKTDVKEFSGICANPGTLIGKVKVLNNPSEINLVNKGDIIVTGMTTPEFVPAMKKASAIITNEGGITCHAAIVSRELGIPCIVGTKIATKLLKDNDLVEIHASNGIVKLLKRQS